MVASAAASGTETGCVSGFSSAWGTAGALTGAVGGGEFAFSCSGQRDATDELSILAVEGLLRWVLSVSAALAASAAAGNCAPPAAFSSRNARAAGSSARALATVPGIAVSAFGATGLAEAADFGREVCARGSSSRRYQQWRLEGCSMR